MNYKNVLSALFYMQQSAGYVSDAHRNRLEQQMDQILEEAYTDLGVVSFKIFIELKRNLQNHQVFFRSPKDSFKKNNATIHISKNIETAPPSFTLKHDYYVHEEVMKCMGGEVDILAYCGATNPTSIEYRLIFSGYKNFSQKEFQGILDKIRSLE